MDAITIGAFTVSQDAKGRFSLNDLHRASGGLDKHQPRYFLANQQTKDLIAELGDSGKSLSVKKGGAGQGTYACKELVYAYGMWISAAFHLRVIRTFDSLANDAGDWRKLRHGAASSNKVANAMLQEVRAAIGKETLAVHYMSEAKLVNWAHSGDFAGMTRDELSTQELDLLQFLELKNATLLGRGIAYADRKPILKQYAIDWRTSHGTLAIASEPAKARG